MSEWYILLCIQVAWAGLLLTVGAVLGKLWGERSMVQVHQWLAHYEALTAYVRCVALPCLDGMEAKRLPNVLRYLLNEIDLVRGYVNPEVEDYQVAWLREHVEQSPPQPAEPSQAVQQEYKPIANQTSLLGWRNLIK